MYPAAYEKRSLLKAGRALACIASVIGCLGCRETLPGTAAPEMPSDVCAMLPWGNAEATLKQAVAQGGAATDGHGRVQLTLRSATSGCPAGSPTGVVNFWVELIGIKGLTMVHIHRDEDAGTDPARVVLFGGSPTDGTSDRLIQGSFSESDVRGMSLREFERLLCNGFTYADVHTTTHPEGEVRGTIVGDGLRCTPGR